MIVWYRLRLALALATLLPAATAHATPVLDGLQDPAFGVAGRVIVDVSSQSLDGEYASAIAEAPSGVLYIGGGNANTGRFVIARTSAQGVRDLGFGTGGLARDRPSGDLNSPHHLYALAVQADGKPVAAGSALTGVNSDVVICRYNVAGNLDSSFGGDGCVRHALDQIAGGRDAAYALTLLPDGKFLLAGAVETALHNGGESEGLLMRLNADGGLDGSFGVGGLRTLSVQNGTTSISGLVRGPDGSLYVTGSYAAPASPFNRERFVAKYSANGALIAAFGSGGVSTLSFDDYVSGTTSNDLPANILLDSQGRVYACGASRRDGPVLVAVAIARYTPSGQSDSSFGVGGRIYRSFNDLNDVSYAQDCALQRDRLVVAMHTGSVAVAGSFALGLMRFLDDGSTDPEFGAGGSINYPLDIGGAGVGHEISGRVLVQGPHLLLMGSASPQNPCCNGPYSYAVVRALGDRIYGDGYE